MGRELRFHHGEPGILTQLLHRIVLHFRYAPRVPILHRFVEVPCANLRFGDPLWNPLHSRLASQNGRGRPRVEQFYGPGAPFERSSNPLPPQRPPAPLQGSILDDFRWILTPADTQNTPRVRFLMRFATFGHACGVSQWRWPAFVVPHCELLCKRQCDFIR